MTDAPRKRPRASMRVLAIVLGALAGLLGGVLTLIFINRDPLPPVTRKDHQQALNRWREADISDYDLSLRVVGNQNSVYHIQVRDSQVVRATRNGQELTRSAERDAWSVEGLFDVIAEDLRLAELAQSPEAPEGLPRLALYGKWHPQLGYPQRYRRVMQGASGERSWAHRVSQGGGNQGGGNQGVAGGETSWEVTRLAPKGR